jgi:TolA-binding protein
MRSLGLVSKGILFSSLVFGLTNCIVTRSQLSESPNPASRYNVPKTYNSPKPISGPVKTSQEVAALETQLRSYEDQFRTMLGRIEELETKASTANKPDSDRVKDLEQAISEMLVQQEQLKNEIKASREAQIQAAQKAKEQAAAAPIVPTGNLEVADKLFSEGRWEVAAQEYQEFRKKNPKSDETSIVTYKIGVCFQELGLKNEAKTFFNSVIKSYPNSKASKFAKFRLDNLK